jgi:hypothetical protein
LQTLNRVRLGANLLAPAIVQPGDVTSGVHSAKRVPPRLCLATRSAEHERIRADQLKAGLALPLVVRA